MNHSFTLRLPFSGVAHKPHCQIVSDVMDEIRANHPDENVLIEGWEQDYLSAYAEAYCELTGITPLDLNVTAEAITAHVLRSDISKAAQLAHHPSSEEVATFQIDLQAEAAKNCASRFRDALWNALPLEGITLSA